MRHNSLIYVALFFLVNNFTSMENQFEKRDISNKPKFDLSKTNSYQSYCTEISRSQLNEYGEWGLMSNNEYGKNSNDNQKFEHFEESMEINENDQRSILLPQPFFSNNKENNKESSMFSLKKQPSLSCNEEISDMSEFVSPHYRPIDFFHMNTNNSFHNNGSNDHSMDLGYFYSEKQNGLTISNQEQNIEPMNDQMMLTSKESSQINVTPDFGLQQSPAKNSPYLNKNIGDISEIRPSYTYQSFNCKFSQLKFTDEKNENSTNFNGDNTSLSQCSPMVTNCNVNINNNEFSEEMKENLSNFSNKNSVYKYHTYPEKPLMKFNFQSFFSESQYRFDLPDHTIIANWDQEIILQIAKRQLNEKEYNKFTDVLNLLDETHPEKKKQIFYNLYRDDIKQKEEAIKHLYEMSNSCDSYLTLTTRFKNILNNFMQKKLPIFLTFDILFFELSYWDANVEIECEINTKNKIFVISKDSIERIPLMFLNKLTNCIIPPVTYENNDENKIKRSYIINSNGKKKKKQIQGNYAICTNKIKDILEENRDNTVLIDGIMALFADPINPVTLKDWRNFNEIRDSNQKKIKTELNGFKSKKDKKNKKKIIIEDIDIINPKAFITEESMELRYKRIVINQLLLYAFLNKINPPFWETERIQNIILSVTEDIFITMQNNDFNRNINKIIYYNNKEIKKEKSGYYNYGLDDDSDGNEQQENSLYDKISLKKYYDELFSQKSFSENVKVSQQPRHSIFFTFAAMIKKRPLPQINTVVDLYYYHPRKFLLMEQLHQKIVYDIMRYNYTRKNLKIQLNNIQDNMINYIKDLVNFSTAMIRVKSNNFVFNNIIFNNVWFSKSIVSFLYPWDFSEHQIRILFDISKQ